MLEPGMLFHDRYRLIEMKGRGSFGEVWLARDEQLDIEVAIKVYIALDDRGVAEFKKEYTTTFGLNHPNLLHAYHFDQFGNRPYLVMPYCPESAMALIGNCDEPTLWRFVSDVASGLAYLHEKDILHHDIKPDNVLRDQEGNFLITDFGISTKMRSTLRRNSTHQANAAPMAGSIPYMAPEMFAANPDAVKATDIWALGATLFEMSEGELPFFGQGGVMQRSGAEVPNLHAGFSATFCQTVQQCLAKEPWERPTAQQLADRAKAMLAGRTPEAFVVQKPLPVNRSTQSMNRPPVAEGSMGQTVAKAAPVSPLPPEQPAARPKKRGWLVGVAVAAVAAIVAAVVLLRPTDADSNFFKQCRTVADYRAYVATYGSNGKHHAEAKAFIDNFVADSTRQTREALAQAEAQRQAEAEAQARAEAEQKEEAAYKKCSTLAGCNSYLKNYPDGKYVEEVKAKKAELEAKAQQEAEKLEEGDRPVAGVKAQQEAEKPAPTTTKPSGSSITVTVNGVSFVMKYVEGGTFQMGATSEQGNDAWDDEKPVHSVTLSTFHMGETEVTQALWKAVMGSEPTFNGGWENQYGRGDNYPAYRVSYNEIVDEFLPRLNRQTGKNFRLPTEAEWEYAARGGKKSNGYKYAGSNNIGNVAWYDDNSGSKTHPVKGKSPNELGLYDMSGNVMEWCSDWYGSYGSGSQTNPKGTPTRSDRVLRGGSWYNGGAGICRVSFRMFNDPDCRIGNGGFRLCLPQ